MVRKKNPPRFRTRGRVNCLAAVIAAVVSIAAAGELNFSAQVDRTTVGLGERLQLTVTVEGQNIGRVPSPKLPALDGFDNLGSTQSQSTSIAFVNGRMTQQQSISFVYVLAAKKTGELVIGPCRITYNGAEYATQPITINVVREAQSRPPPARSPARRGFDPFAEFFEEPAPAGEGDVFLSASADRSEVYVGEQVTVTYTLYTTEQVGAMSVKDAPGFSGFWVDNLYEAKQLEYQPTTVRGRRYYAATIRRVALFPTQAGELVVGPMTLSGQMVRPGFFFSQAAPFEVSSPRIRVKAKPLPESGRPADFCGGVGDFSLTASLSKDSSAGGEPLRLTVRIAGTGNIGIISPPTVVAVPGVKLLAPETKDNLSRSGGRVGGTRDFMYPLIPQQDGRFILPEVSISFFSARGDSYYTLRSARLEFVASGAYGGGAGEPAEPGMRLLGSEIVHIKTRVGRPAFAHTGWAVFFYPAGVAVLVAGLILGRHRRRLEADQGYARRARSSGLVKKRLKQATQLLRQGRHAEFYATLSQAILGFVGDRYNLGVTGMTGEELRRALSGHGVAGTVIDGLLDLIGRCDAARFSPGAVQCDPARLLEQANDVLEKL
uniref:Protein BatD n=1 Tax=candidate division WOR-3 bacterium TaxID=2052148 RepID=A0A7C4GED5_UNCW3